LSFALNGEADIAWHACSRLEPMNNTLLACSTSQHNKADVVPAIAVRYFDHMIAIGALTQLFTFPDILFHACLAQFLYAWTIKRGRGWTL